MQRSLGSWSGVGRMGWQAQICQVDGKTGRKVEMSGQAKLGLLPCKQGLAGSKPRQWGHYCCDGAVGEMVMSGERVGVFLHVKYGHKGRHMYTHTHTQTGEDTQAHVHTHIHTGALS